MVKYKLMFKDTGKRFYNFNPTIARNGKYNNITSIPQAKKVLTIVKKDWKNRDWKIKKK